MMKVTVHKNYRLLVILGIGLIVRLLMLSQLHHGYFESNAMLKQGEYARNLINGNGLKINREYVRIISEMQTEKNELVDYQDVPGPDEENLTERTVQDTPGYAFLLAATWKLFGEQRYIYVQVIQVLIDTLMIFLVFRIGSDFFNRQIGFLAGCFYALYLPQARLAVAASRDTWATFAVIISLYLLSRMIKNREHSRRWVYYTLVGLVIGLSTWLRPTVAFIPIFIGIAIFFKDGIKECLVAIMVPMFVVSIIFLLPYMMMNYRDFGRPFVGPLGQGLWEGMGEAGENKYGFVFNDEKALEWANNQGCGCGYGTPEFDDFLKEYAVNVIKKDPLFYLSTVVKRLPSVILLRNDYGVPNASYSGFKEETGGGLKEFILKYPFQFFYKSFRAIGEGLLAIIALIGFWISREKWRQNLLLAAFPVYFIVVHVPILVVSRYILPGTFPYLIFAAVLVYAVYEKIKLRKSSS